MKMEEPQGNDHEAIAVIMFEFKLDPRQPCGLGDSEGGSFRSRLLDLLSTTFDTKFRPLAASRSLKVNTEVLETTDGKGLLYLRLYQRGHLSTVLTLTLEILGRFDSKEVDQRLGQFADEERIRMSLDDPPRDLAPDETLVGYLPILRRGLSYSPYFRTSDERFLELNIKGVLYNVRSPFQHVVIVDTVDLGPTLILDGHINLSERDREPYTHALMDLPKERHRYPGSRVLILGGGDGGLLKELLDLEEGPPLQVTMVEIDEAVLTGCALHLQSVNGGYLDEASRTGPRHRVICEDAVAFMQRAQAEGMEFDFVFGDLTDCPIRTKEIDPPGSSRSKKSPYQQAMELALNLIKPGSGKLLTHCCGKNAPPEVAESFESMLRDLRIGGDGGPEGPPSSGKRCVFTRSESFVPSFMEVWLFYQVSVVAA